MHSARLAFVGTGRMGANMARRLKDRGHAVTAVYDPATAAADALATELGATRPTSLAAVTAAADVIFTVVPDDAAQLAVFAEEGDSLLVGAAGRVFVNCATLTPAVHLEVERRACAAGAGSLEAWWRATGAGFPTRNPDFDEASWWVTRASAAKGKAAAPPR